MQEEPPPLISERTAVLCAAIFTTLYIAPFYLSPTLRTSSAGSRDAPSVIQARVRAVGLTCTASTGIAVLMLTVRGNSSAVEVLRLLGIWPVNPIDILKVLGLVMLLFTCSLYELLIVDGEWRHWSPGGFKEGIWDSWTGYRNLVVAPLSEELVFRALTIPLFLLANWTPTRIVFLTPLIFGLAHLHHLIDFLQARTPANKRCPPLTVCLTGMLMSTFQFTYTSIFGFFAAFVFLRTGSLWAAVVAHSFCNWMGVPRLRGRVGQYEDEGAPLTPAQLTRADGKVPGAPVNVGNGLMQDEYDESKGDSVKVEGPKNLGIAWTVVYYVLVFVGAYGFYKSLFPLTESANALARF